MGWWMAHDGISTDAKYLAIMRESGADGAQVLGIWTALLDCASQARPRGSIARFDVASWSDFAGIEPGRVRAVMEAMEGRLVKDGHLMRWPARQPKPDATAKERKQRWRERQRGGSATPAEGGTVRNAVPAVPKSAPKPANLNGNGRNEAEDIQRISDASNASKAGCKSNTPSDSLRIACADEAMDAGAIWQRLDAEGFGITWVGRRWHTDKVRRWLDAGVTSTQFTEAIERARAARARAGDDRPLNVGFLDQLVAEVLAGKPAKSSTGGGYEHGDELSRQHAARAR